MNPIIIYSAVFFGVAATIGALAFIMHGDKEDEVEKRLSALTSGKKSSKGDAVAYKDLLATVRGDTAGRLEQFVSRYLNLQLLFEQADVSLDVPKFLMICAGSAAVGLLLPLVAGFSVVLGPVMAAILGFLPIVWL